MSLFENEIALALGELSQTFPEAQKQDVEMALEDLATDLAKPQRPAPNRLAKRLKPLFNVVATVAAATSGVTDFSGNLNDLTGNVLEFATTAKALIEKLNFTLKDFWP